MSTSAGAASALAPRPDAWQRNVFAVTAASFMGYTGFTLVMPFLPLFIGRLGVTDVGQVAMWTGVSLGITPALTALLSPAWGRLGDRFGRKIMVERSLVSFVVLMTAMAFVTQAWHVLAIRAVQGLFAGYGSLSVAMAAESAPRDRMPNAIGLVQTAQRIGPGVGPVVGGILAGLVDLRRVFLLTAGFYAAGLVIVHLLYDDRATHAAPADPADSGRVTFRDVLAFQNFLLMMVVIFGLQFVDRSFGPVLPLWVEQTGVAPSRVALTSGVLFSIMTGASLLFGVGIGAAMTASYSAAGAVIPPGAHGAGFGVLTSASLVGMASSPFIAGFVGGASLRIVFFVDAVVFAALAVAVRRLMTAAAAA